MATKIHITSLVVHASPGKLESIKSRIAQLPATEIHTGEPQEKFIVLLETENEQQILDAIQHIREIDGVLNTAMVYHHIDE